MIEVHPRDPVLLDVDLGGVQDLRAPAARQLDDPWILTPTSAGVPAGVRLKTWNVKVAVPRPKTGKLAQSQPSCDVLS
jgi:hypothetical protein